MTTTQVPETPEADPVSNHVLWTVLWRLAFVTALTVFAFWDSLVRTTIDTLPGGLYGYLLMMPLVVLAMAIGLTRRGHEELPIHDREVDVIVGAIAMVLSVATMRLLVPRYRETFFLLRLDLLAMLLFVFGACVLVFGLRAAGRFWPIWLSLLLVSPLGHRVAVIMLGGTWWSVAVVSSILIAIGIGVAVGRTDRLGWIGFGATIAVSAVLLGVVFVLGWPTPRGPVSARCAPVAAGTAVAITMLWMSVRRRDPNWSLRPTRKSPVERPWKSALLAGATAVVLAVSPLPQEVTLGISTGPPLTGAAGVVPPAGWSQTAFVRMPWAADFFGAGASLTRQTWMADEVNPAWDDKGRRRSVVVDTLLTRDPDSLNIYPSETLYTTINGRRSPNIDVDLGSGVTGQLYTIVDQSLFLTWTKLNFLWTRGDGVVQVVNIISVDNHDPDAQFPGLDPGALAIVTQSVNVLLRGNSVEEDDNPEYKDADMLTTLGRDVVAEQWEVAAQ